jgi:DNA invertase Pin-like site-specific DNA recombinase
MQRAALYARFSSDRQNERSAADQLALCTSFCERQGYMVVARHSDSAVSGETVHGRHGLAALRRDVLARKCDVVVVEDYDRLSRGMSDLPRLFEEFQFAGVKLIAVNEGEADQIRIGVRGIVGALYLTDLRNKTRRGCEGNIREGKRAGGLPYGYRPILGRPGEHEIYEPEAEIVRRIFKEYIGGLTPRRIACGLNRDKVPPVRGRAWNASTLNGSLKRGTGLLSNEVYDGEIVWNKVGKVKNPATGRRVPRINPRDAWKRAPAAHLRIVDPDTFAKAQAIREGRANGPGQERRKGPQRLLSGLLKCFCCGSSIVAAGTSRVSRTGGPGRRRGICSRALESGSCSNRRPIYLDTLEQAVLDGLCQQLAHPEIIEAATREYHAEMRRLDVERSMTRARDERKLTELRRSIDRLVDLVAAGDVPGSTVARKIAEAEAEAHEIADRLVAAGAPDVIALHPKALDHYLGALKQLSVCLANRHQGEALGWSGNLWIP